MDAAAYLEKADPTARYTADSRALLGALYLLAARKARQACRDIPETDRLLARAQAQTRYLGADHRSRGVMFGPTEISIARIEMALSHANFDDVARLAALAGLA
ncbi:hypothetical protein ABZ942_04145 [Nocardia sp. NPDC046473]|uniref:hypothetical protein n=1 Tax=Nocardia sp. NPDC046473 TaxID=3155733 RepID=UPI0034044FA5